MRRLILGAVVVALCLATPAQANFGRMFPNLPPFTEPSNQQLADLAQTQLDPNDAVNDNPAVPSIITYGGQFADHDLTRDQAPSPTEPVDPTTLRNFRTPKLDLDSVYGNGPEGSPQLYEADGEHLRVADPNVNGVLDVPRNPDGSAIIGDDRNDENRIIGQLHLAFLLAHNRLIDDGNSFAQARQTLTEHWQRIIVDEYLPAIAGQEREDHFLRCHKRKCHVRNELFKRPGPRSDPMTPVEFSVAAFRFGHSEVRKAYEIREETGKVQVFSFTEPDLRGGSPLPANLVIQWGNFARELTEPDDVDGINLTRDIDTLISSSLFQLPIPGAEAAGSNVLAFRNMVRGKFYGLPSYEKVAKRMGVKPVSLDLGPGFTTGTPLWYGNLAESEIREGGLKLGPVGGRLVDEVFLTFLERDPKSYLNDRHFRLDPEIAGDDGRMTFSDLLVFSGLAQFPDDE